MQRLVARNIVEFSDTVTCQGRQIVSPDGQTVHVSTFGLYVAAAFVPAASDDLLVDPERLRLHVL